MKELKNAFNRDFYNVTTSAEPYNDEFNTEEEIRERSDLDGCIGVFEGTLEFNRKTN